VANTHDLAFYGFGGDFEAGGDTFAFDEERVVTGGLKALRHSGENIGVLMLNGRGFPMHEVAGSNDFPTKMLSNALMAEAHAKERNACFSRSLGNGKGAAGFIGATGSGGEHDAFGVKRNDLIGGDFVVSVDFLFYTELTEILNQIVGERVEVVDDEEHSLYMSGSW